MSLRTGEARKAIRFTQAKDGRIVIEAVAVGSEAQEVRSSEALGMTSALPCKSTTFTPAPDETTQTICAGWYQTRSAALEHLRPHQK